MNVVATANLKGGVGKTSVIANIAGVLASQGNRVVMLDMDAQGNLTSALGVDVRAHQGKTMSDIFKTQGDISPIDLIISTKVAGIDLIPADIGLLATDLTIAHLSGREMIVRNWLSDNRISLSEKYDYLLIDTNPSFSIVSQNAFIAVNAIILVTDVSMNAFDGAQQFEVLWKGICRRLRIDNNIKAMVINNFDKRIGISKSYIDFLRDHAWIGPILILPPIPNSVHVKESEISSTLLSISAPSSAPYRAYIEIVGELKRRAIL